MSATPEYSIPSVSTPTIPGSYPPDPIAALDHLSEASNPPGIGGFDLSQHVETARHYLPSGQQVQQTVGSAAETAKQYIPSKEDVQSTIGNVSQIAKQYIPQTVIDTVTKVLRTSYLRSCQRLCVLLLMGYSCSFKCY